MAAQTYTARAVAKRLGGTMTDKRVRAWVREHVARFDDDGYTAHAYTSAEFAAIVKGMSAANKSGRATAARNGRKAPSARKRTATPATAPVAPSES